MMSLTHAAIATAGTSLILGTSDPLALFLGILGSQLPDLDTTTSMIGQICYPISSWIEDRYPHRSITHCLLATLALAAVSIPIGYSLGHLRSGLALPLGHLLSCFSDTFTKQGVQLFFPYPAWAISVSNPRRRLKSGGANELWVLGGAIAALTVGLYLAMGGGITQQVSQSLGLKEGIVRIYNEKAATHQLYADIRGVWAGDRTRADGRYSILSTEGSEFIVTEGKGIYKTGQQIIVERLTSEIGQAATTQMQTLSFSDEQAAARLQMLIASPQSAIYLSDGLTVDFPDEMAIAPLPNQYPVASLSGTTLTLEYCPVEQAIALLKEQYATGTVMVKVIQTVAPD